jgi:hypothetical protein
MWHLTALDVHNMKVRSHCLGLVGPFLSNLAQMAALSHNFTNSTIFSLFYHISTFISRQRRLLCHLTPQIPLFLPVFHHISTFILRQSCLLCHIIPQVPLISPYFPFHLTILTAIFGHAIPCPGNCHPPRFRPFFLHQNRQLPRRVS